MSLIGEIQKILSPRRGETNREFSGSYSAKKAFLAYVENGLTGIKLGTGYTGAWGQRRHVPPFTIEPKSIVHFMRRGNTNSVAVHVTREYREIDDRTILLQVTVATYSIHNGRNWHRPYNDQESVMRNMLAETPTTVNRCFLIRLSENLRIEVDGNTIHLGIIGQGSIVSNEGINLNKCVIDGVTYLSYLELKGRDALIWDENDRVQIDHLVNLMDATYTSPTFKGRPFELKCDTQGETIGGKLILHKLSDDYKINRSVGMLACLETSKPNITASFGERVSLTYLEGDEIVSQDIDPGTYLVTLQEHPTTLYEYRSGVIDAVSDINIHSEITRMDFLTPIDISGDSSIDDDIRPLGVSPDVQISIDDSITIDDSILNRM